MENNTRHTCTNDGAWEIWTLTFSTLDLNRQAHSCCPLKDEESALEKPDAVLADVSVPPRKVSILFLTGHEVKNNRTAIANSKPDTSWCIGLVFLDGCTTCIGAKVRVRT